MLRLASNIESNKILNQQSFSAAGLMRGSGFRYASELAGSRFRRYKKSSGGLWLPSNLSNLSFWTKADDPGGRHYVTANGNANITTGVSDPFSNSNGVGDFDGSGDYLSITSSSDFGFGTGDFTIEMWVYWVDGGETNPPIFSLGTYITGILMRIQASSDSLYINNTAYNWNPTTHITESTWTHIALVRNSGNVKVYVDGTSVLNVTNSSSIPTAAIEIGKSSHTTTEYYGGKMSNFRISNTAIYTSNFTTPTSPLEQYSNTKLLAPMTGTNNSTVFVDDATPDNAGTVASWNDMSGSYNHVRQSTVADRPALVDGEISFDGSTEHMIVDDSASISLSTDLTLSIVVKLDQLTNSHGILGKQNSFLLWRWNDSTKLCFRLYESDSSTVDFSSIALDDTDTHIITITVNSSTQLITVYIDGVSQGTVPYDGTIQDTADDLIIGKDGNGTTYLDGSISEIIYYNSSLFSTDRQKVENYLSRWQ